jgi:hypothetical protein
MKKVSARTRLRDGAIEIKRGWKREDRQTDRMTERQKERKRDRERKREREIERARFPAVIVGSMVGAVPWVRERGREGWSWVR